MSTAEKTLVRLGYTVEEAAEMLGISRAHVFNLINAGELRSVKLGRSRRIPADALTALMGGGDAVD